MSSPDSEPDAGGPRRVLVVDDSLTWREAVAADLREEGWEVEVAGSGEAALERLGAGLEVSAILMDVVMPGMGGFDACRRIKAQDRWRGIPLLMLTAAEDEPSAVRGFAAGADDYIPKGSDASVVRARLRAHVRRRELEEQAARIRVEFARREAERRAEAARELAELRAEMIASLEAKNRELRHRNEELDQFVRVAGHDLRAPIRTLAACLEKIRARAGDALDDRSRRELAWSLDVAGRVQTLLRDLLSYARAGGGAPQARDVDAGELVALVERDLADRIEAAGARVERGPLPVVRGDPTLLGRVFTNLIANAVEYCGDRPPVVRIEAEPTGEREATFSVHDEGPGIPPEDAERIFEPFERLHGADHPGTGIGLAIVKKIVERHGGRIWVEPGAQRGSTFRFTLEAASVSAPDRAARSGRPA